MVILQREEWDLGGVRTRADSDLFSVIASGSKGGRVSTNAGAQTDRRADTLKGEVVGLRCDAAKETAVSPKINGAHLAAPVESGLMRSWRAGSLQRATQEDNRRERET